ncbi:MAG: DUF523 domain-containing protein [Coriobacteriia bacterium]|nr:DUF523 domain-containing protein [Coriobacteriia bacterium]
MPLRGRRIVVVAHCVLNSNSKVDGLANYAGAIRSTVAPLVESGVGIVQLPCPEATFLGMKRWGMTYEQYDTPAYRRHCRRILAPVIHELVAFDSAGYSLESVIGIDNSPSCGVNLTCRGYTGGEIETVPTSTKSPGRGVFIEELQALLAARSLAIDFQAVDEDEPEA